MVMLLLALTCKRQLEAQDVQRSQQSIFLNHAILLHLESLLTLFGCKPTHSKLLPVKFVGNCIKFWQASEAACKKVLRNLLKQFP
jgi:hypothetical protein